MSRPIEFVKMSGAGNDFIVLDAEQASRLGEARTDWIRDVCRRRLSIGADGVLVVTPVATGRVRVEFCNPDGSPAFCGNGSRCAARFAVLRGMASAALRMETAVGDVRAEVDGDRVALTLPAPVGPRPMTLELASGPVSGAWVLAGVPHFLVDVERVDRAPLEEWGPEIRRHREFGAPGTNFDVVGREEDGTLPIRTWERGVEGETLACGSGALAAAFLEWHRTGRAGTRVLPASGVPIRIDFDGSPAEPGDAIMTGDARTIYEGTWIGKDG